MSINYQYDQQQLGIIQTIQHGLRHPIGLTDRLVGPRHDGGLPVLGKTVKKAFTPSEQQIMEHGNKAQRQALANRLKISPDELQARWKAFCESEEATGTPPNPHAPTMGEWARGRVDLGPHYRFMFVAGPMVVLVSKVGEHGIRLTPTVCETRGRGHEAVLVVRGGMEETAARCWRLFERLSGVGC